MEVVVSSKFVVHVIGDVISFNSRPVLSIASVVAYSAIL